MSSVFSKSKEEFRFLLLGKTGCGKSTTGNTILGADLFDSDVSFESVTSECSLKRTRTEERMIEIMDSPGLFDTTKPHEEISALVMQAIACMHPGPDAVFYVMKVGRYTEEEHGVYNRLKALLDNYVTKYLIVLFTHGDTLKGKNMRQLLDKAPPRLQEVLEECNYRYVVIDNIHRDDPRQVEDLLQLVKQVREENGNKPYQCPKYAHVGEKMEEEVSKRMAEVEAKELENKKHVQELTHNLEMTQEKANKEKEEFERREKEREAAAAARQRESKAKMQELANLLQAQKVSEENWKKQMDKLRTETENARKMREDEDKRARQAEKEELDRLKEEKEAARRELEKQKEESKKELKTREAQMEKLKDEVARKPARRGGGCTIL